MNYTTELVLTRHGGTHTRGLWVTIVVSVLLHLLLLVNLPMPMRTPTPDLIGDAAPLVVQLVPPAAPARPPTQAAPTQPAQPAQPQPPARPAAPPPPIAIPQPGPGIPAPIPEPAIADPAPAPAPSAADLLAYINARRTAGNDATPTPAAPAAPADDENARASRRAAANLRLTQPPAGQQKTESGGVFQVKHKGYDYADLMFYGWHLEIRRNIPQQFDVRKGNSATIELAVVRKMIEIIRQYEKEDFTFHSRRQGRSLKLSARLRDTESLEQFLLREFF